MILTDTGFWCALINKNDKHHERATNVLSRRLSEFSDSLLGHNYSTYSMYVPNYRALSDYAIANPTYKNTDLTHCQPSKLSQAWKQLKTLWLSVL